MIQTRLWQKQLHWKCKPKQLAKSWLSEISDGSGFGMNSLRFDTVAECKTYASNLFSRWMAAKEWRVAIAEPTPAAKAE